MEDDQLCSRCIKRQNLAHLIQEIPAVLFRQLLLGLYDLMKVCIHETESYIQVSKIWLG